MLGREGVTVCDPQRRQPAREVVGAKVELSIEPGSLVPAELVLRDLEVREVSLWQKVVGEGCVVVHAADGPCRQPDVKKDVSFTSGLRAE